MVFDANAVVAGIVAEGLCREILEIHVPEHTPILSQVLWDELVTTLRRKFGLTPDDLPIVALYRQHADWCEPAKLSKAVCRDRRDAVAQAVRESAGRNRPPLTRGGLVSQPASRVSLRVERRTPARVRRF